MFWPIKEALHIYESWQMVVGTHYNSWWVFPSTDECDWMESHAPIYYLFLNIFILCCPPHISSTAINFVQQTCFMPQCRVVAVRWDGHKCWMPICDASRNHLPQISTLIARFMGPTWGPSGANRTQVGPMLAPLILLYGDAFVFSEIREI